MAANGISTLTIGLTATSHTASFLVAPGTFTYDAYGTGFVIRKDGGTVDAYMAQVLALPEPPARQYTRLAFTYGQALINFTLNPNGTFSNVTVADGAGGYPYGGAVDPAITMPGNQFVNGTTPANDIQWEYTASNGVITGFTYRSGTPPTGRFWTFVPANGQPSFTRLMNPPDGTQFSTEEADTYAAIWNVTTNNNSFLQGTGANELNTALIPIGTEFNIYLTELGAVGLADKEARQKAKLDLAQAKRRGFTLAADGSVISGPDTTKAFYRARNEYNINSLPTQYVGITAVPNTEPGDLQLGRPWIALPRPQYLMILENGDVQTLETEFDDFVTE
jgi:hypothetical protein